ncbi:DUF5658 family protein [Gudongella sp. DL1XJH-153]|uniref:DUF5658 family protein n=1 Tax=Gudongella sp. DL1XJH-153 TaxID=3409804 RepID=UPI003BB6C855
MSDSKKRLLFWHLVGIGVFNKVDYILTLEFLDNGFYEANPLMATMIGTYEFPMVKLILVPLVLLALWQHKDKIGDLITKLSWVPFLGYFSLMVYYRFLIVSYL